jgi:ferredoxin-nitrite reductase
MYNIMSIVIKNSKNMRYHQLRCKRWLLFTGHAVTLLVASLPIVNAFVARTRPFESSRNHHLGSRSGAFHSVMALSAEAPMAVTGKPTGSSFLPPETLQRAKKGSPIEKLKLEKDGTSAFVDVYEYARKIRNGEMTWEEVEKADLDTVRTKLM